LSVSLEFRDKSSLVDRAQISTKRVDFKLWIYMFLYRPNG
jgi:hypothetical protein